MLLPQHPDELTPPAAPWAVPGHHLHAPKDHLTSTLRAPRGPSQSHAAKLLFIASCCFCIFSPPSSLMRNMAPAPTSLLAALRLHKAPCFLLSELLPQQIPPSSLRSEQSQGSRLSAGTAVPTLRIKGSLVAGEGHKGEQRTREPQLARS